jgi:hypothetical protein
MASASRAGPATVPIWSGSFEFAGQQYPFTMVGNSPQASVTVHVPVVVIPINLTFQHTVGSVSPYVLGSTRIGSVLESPVLNPTSFPETQDTTEFSDAVARAEFSSEIRNRRSYHTLVEVKAVMAPVNIAVPSDLGEVVNPGDGIPRAEVDGDWWSQVIPNLVSSLGISPDVLPIFVTSDLGAGIEAGFHGAFAGISPNGKPAIWTYVWASWFDPGWFSTFGLSADVGADADVLSHEVTEWMNDPFLNNIVPAWSFSAPPVIVDACSNLLETGDPLEETPFTVSLNGRTYHLQDAAFFSWFARQNPSIAYAGRYSFLGTLDSFSTPCA